MKIEISPIIRFLVVSATIGVLLLTMKFGATIVNTFIMALVITICAVPLQERIRRRERPIWQALLISALAVFLVVGGTVIFLIFSMGRLLQALPTYSASMQERMVPVTDALTAAGVPALSEIIQPISFLESVANFVIGTAGNIFVVGFMLVMVIFMLLEAFYLPGKALQEMSSGSTFLKGIRTYSIEVRKYVYITAQAGALAGALDAVFLLILGVDFAILWGVLAALLSFIPSIGFIFSLIPPMILAFAQYGWEAALVVLLGYWIINGTVDNIIKPRFIGEGLNLSTLVVFLSVFLWGWVLGPIGGLLSVPITMMFKTLVLDSHDNTRWLSNMMKTGENLTDKTASESEGQAK